MAGKNIIMATQEELKRFHVVQKILEGSLKQDETLRNWLIKEGALGKGGAKRGFAGNGESEKGVLARCFRPACAGRWTEAITTGLKVEVRRLCLWVV